MGIIMAFFFFLGLAMGNVWFCDNMGTEGMHCLPAHFFFCPELAGAQVDSSS